MSSHENNPLLRYEPGSLKIFCCKHRDFPHQAHKYFFWTQKKNFVLNVALLMFPEFEYEDKHESELHLPT